MIRFELNQQVGRALPKNLWQSTIKRVEKILRMKKPVEISIAIVGNSAIKKLNKIYRKKNRVTDVLSFSETDGEKYKFSPASGKYLGEVIICYPQARKQARLNGKKIDDEIRLLLVHGILHLLGYDHEKPADTRKMRGLESKILG